MARQNDYGTALEHFSESISLNSSYYRSWSAKASALYFLQRTSEANEAIDRALTLIFDKNSDHYKDAMRFKMALVVFQPLASWHALLNSRYCFLVILPLFFLTISRTLISSTWRRSAAVCHSLSKANAALPEMLLKQLSNSGNLLTHSSARLEL